MRLDVRRIRGQAQYKPPPPTDRRGRHRKRATAQEQADTREALSNLLHEKRPCGCDWNTAPVAYSDGYITCTGCGTVLESQVFMPRRDYYGGDCGNGIDLDQVDRLDPTLWNCSIHEQRTRSKPYEHANHAAERLKSAIDADPRMPPMLLDVLAERWNQRYHGVADPDYTDILYASQRDITGLLSAVDPRLVRSYGERWLQIKIHICGRGFYDKYGPHLMPVQLVYRIHARYQCYARAFCELRRLGHPLFRTRKNIPQLNASLVQMMAQETPEHITCYGWYFPLLRTIGKRLVTEYRIRTILSYIRRLDCDEGYTWKYVPVTTEADRILFAKNPKQREVLLLRELRDCGCLPRSFKSLSKAYPRPRSTSPLRQRKTALQ